MIIFHTFVIIDTIIRLIPGVLGNQDSLNEETFEKSLLEYPQYTRPKVWVDQHGNEHHVPDILISGHHEKINKWRKIKSIEITKKFRPDLLKRTKKVKN